MSVERKVIMVKTIYITSLKNTTSLGFYNKGDLLADVTEKLRVFCFVLFLASVTV